MTDNDKRQAIQDAAEDVLLEHAGARLDDREAMARVTESVLDAIREHSGGIDARVWRVRANNERMAWQWTMTRTPPAPPPREAFVRIREGGEIEVLRVLNTTAHEVSEFASCATEDVLGEPVAPGLYGLAHLCGRWWLYRPREAQLRSGEDVPGWLSDQPVLMDMPPWAGEIEADER